MNETTVTTTVTGDDTLSDDAKNMIAEQEGTREGFMNRLRTSKLYKCEQNVCGEK